MPVSVRAKDQHDDLGNRIVVMRGPLPVYVEDPVARLRVVRQAMDGLKDSKQAVGAEVITGLEALAPPTILAQASRLQFSTRLFNLLVTNVPGPQFPLYVLGRELEDLFPVAFLPENQSLAVAVMSYNGRMDFGLLGDYDAMPDIEELGDALRESLAELVEAAGGGKPRRAAVAGAFQPSSVRVRLIERPVDERLGVVRVVPQRHRAAVAERLLAPGDPAADLPGAQPVAGARQGRAREAAAVAVAEARRGRASGPRRSSSDGHRRRPRSALGSSPWGRRGFSSESASGVAA